MSAKAAKTMIDEIKGSPKEDLSSTSLFTLYPNPANRAIQLISELSENTQAQICDAFGKLVKHITEVELISGSLCFYTNLF